MQALDFSPFYRSTIGFDRLASLFDSATTGAQTSYPPYNIERTGDNDYRITMAVAGISPDEIDIEVKENTLTITGNTSTREQSKKRNYLHRGIAERSFMQRFQLADHVEVTEAALENGILHIDLVREIPETLKPKKIKILTSNGKKKLASPH